MGRIYTAQFAAVAVTAATDLFEINVASTKIVKIHEIHLMQTTDLGDAAEEVLAIKMISGYTSSGSGGSAPTAAPHEIGDAAYAGTVEVNNTTQANTGTAVTHYTWGWNIRVPFQMVFTPETRKAVAPSGRLVITNSAPADSITVSGTCVFEEIG